MSNNEAEYRGLLEGLELALRLRPEKVLFHLDSQIVVGQVTGRFAARSNKLKNLCRQSREKLAELEKQGIQPRLLFVPREYNLLADALAADALLVIPEHKFNLPEISVTEEEV
jgi:ribonuclease HI